MNCTAPIPVNEMARLDAVKHIPQASSATGECYNQITDYVANKLTAPLSFISIINKSRIKFLSSHGSEVKEIPREHGICSHAITEVKSASHFMRLYEISDFFEHEKFRHNPLVCGPPEIRSYLSYTLQSDDGFNLGTLCVMDSCPRIFSDENKFDIAVAGEVTNRLLLGKLP